MTCTKGSCCECPEDGSEPCPYWVEKLAEAELAAWRRRFEGKLSRSMRNLIAEGTVYVDQDEETGLCALCFRRG
jgi:hypothetical protein